MTREEINKMFDFLDKELNFSNMFYFKLNSGGNINAYWKSDDKIFAEIYSLKILKYLKEQENER